MEITIPPNRRVHSPSPSLPNYSIKALPPLPMSPISQVYHGRAEIPWSPTRNQRYAEKAPVGLVIDPQYTTSTSTIPKAKVKLPPPPPTPMSKSSRKVLQLTGFNPNYERTFLDDMHLYDASSSDLSSGSTYSHEEEDAVEPVQNAHVEGWNVMLPVSAPVQTEHSGYMLQSTVYSSSESSIHQSVRRDMSLASSLRSRVNSDNVSLASSNHPVIEILNKSELSPVYSPLSRAPGTRTPSIHSRRQQKRAEQQLQNTSRFVTTPTYEDLVAQERARLGIDNDWDHEDLDFPVSPDHAVAESPFAPRPLELRPKTRLEVRPMSHFSDHSSESSSRKKPSMLSSARESFATGIRELASPTRSRHNMSPGSGPSLTSPSSPRQMRTPPALFPPPPPPTPPLQLSPQTKRKRDWASGNHPLKSPFPFGRKVSGAMKKRFSVGSATTRETSLITNGERSADGPDTPLPRSTGGVLMRTLQDSADVLQKGNSQILGAVKKAKKTVRVRSPSEKRRDELKKQITVIGHSDQTPGKLPFPSTHLIMSIH
ncbi:hypothetical protein PVAG01_05329 [Phlyctema vagabunda]|uniref:Uncharacterized protein n=1 Tax=Phlyctema vagabunda TaxID=108571 RepID=A0ABR4PJQ6_9HELO